MEPNDNNVNKQAGLELSKMEHNENNLNKDNLGRTTEQSEYKNNINKLNGPELIRFIRKYREKECLWNIYCYDYRKPHLKNEKYEELAREFEMSKDEIKHKINILRSCYNREIKRFLYDEKFESKLYYFEEMSFLKEIVKGNHNRKSGKNNANESNRSSKSGESESYHSMETRRSQQENFHFFENNETIHSIPESLENYPTCATKQPKLEHFENYEHYEMGHDQSFLPSVSSSINLNYDENESTMPVKVSSNVNYDEKNSAVPVKVASNINLEENDNSMPSRVSLERSKNATKRKNVCHDSIEQNNEDQWAIFGLFIADIIREFPRSTQKRARQHITRYLLDLENESDRN